MEWFYEDNGRQAGPVSRAEILRLILQKRINPETLVWTAAFGNEWKQASQAGLVSTVTGLVRPSAGIGSHWAWVALAAPFAIDWLTLAILEFRHLPADKWGAPLNTVMLLHMGVFFTALLLDRNAVREGGVKPPSFWWWLFMPGYFWVRMRRTGHGKVLFAMSIALRLLDISIGIVEMPKIRQEISHSVHSQQEPQKSGGNDSQESDNEEI